MDQQKKLTNQTVRDQSPYTSQFDLVNYAIRVASQMIHSGRGPLIKTQSQNPAVQVLSEIETYPDQLDQLIEKKTKEHEQAKVAPKPAPEPIKESISFEEDDEEEEEEEETVVQNEI